MEFDQIIGFALVFIQTHLLISIASLLVVIYIACRNPKESFKFLLFLAFLAGACYFIMQLGNSTNSGVRAKEELGHKTQKAIDQ